MGKPEALIEGYFARRATDAGIMTRKLTWISRNGAPDRFNAYEGGVLLTEFKSEKGKLSAAQEREIAELRSQGVEVAVISTACEADAAIQHMLRRRVDMQV